MTILKDAAARSAMLARCGTGGAAVLRVREHLGEARLRRGEVPQAEGVPAARRGEDLRSRTVGCLGAVEGVPGVL